MEQKRTGLSYVFTLAKGERGKLVAGMALDVLCSAFRWFHIWWSMKFYS